MAMKSFKQGIFPNTNCTFRYATLTYNWKLNGVKNWTRTCLEVAFVENSENWRWSFRRPSFQESVNRCQLAETLGNHRPWKWGLHLGDTFGANSWRFGISLPRMWSQSDVMLRNVGKSHWIWGKIIVSIGYYQNNQLLYLNECIIPFFIKRCISACLLSSFISRLLNACSCTIFFLTQFSFPVLKIFLH